MSTATMDKYRQRSLEAYKRMAISIASDEEFPPDKIAGICFAAGRTPGDLERHLSELRSRRYWTVTAPQEARAAMVENTQWADTCDKLEKQIEALREKFEPKLAELMQDLAYASSQRAIEQNRRMNVSGIRQQIFSSTAKPAEWIRENNRLAQREVDAKQAIQDIARQIRNAEEADLATKGLEAELKAARGNWQQVLAEIKAHAALATRWDYIDWSTAEEAEIPKLC